MANSRRKLLGWGLAATLVARGDPALAGPVAAPPGRHALARRMYERAFELALAHVRGGEGEPRFRRPFVDAAFSDNIFLWDTCTMAAFARYHQDRLPIGQALDNFYEMQEGDGFICREYTREGEPMWPREHPVSINPPLLAFAELELFAESGDRARLVRVLPHLARFFEFLVRTYRCEDGLFFSDALGSGMDNIARHPEGWEDDGRGIAMRNLHPALFRYEGRSPAWNRQGRSVDFSAQMAYFAQDLARICRLVASPADAARYQGLQVEFARAINALCWHEGDGFYYDLGYGRQIRRRHIGMFWTLVAGVARGERAGRLVEHLTDRRAFWRRVPVASYPADQPGFAPDGAYWLGGVWAPTNLMVIRGLREIGRADLALRLAQDYYRCVSAVFEQTGTFWENYAPDSFAPGSPARRDFCGWTAIVPIGLWHEFGEQILEHS